MIKVKEYNMNLDYKIVLISDIHYTKLFNLNLFNKIIKEVKRINPDYILILGDIFDRPKDISVNVTNFIKELSQINKTFIILGNHDYNDKIDNLDYLYSLKDKNIIPLHNESYQDNKISIRGITLSNNYYTLKEKSMEELLDHLKDKTEYDILMTHSPINLYDMDLSNYKLVVCGHTHSGLLPSFFKTNYGIISPVKKFIPKYVRGKFKNIIVSGGITKFSITSSVFIVLNKLYCSEITVIK